MIEEHSHCHICGRTIAVGNDLCNDKSCLEKQQEALAMKKRSMWLFIALIAAVLALQYIL